MKLIDEVAQARRAVAEATRNITCENATSVGAACQDPDICALTMIEWAERLLGERLTPDQIRCTAAEQRATADALDRLAASREAAAS